MRQIIRNFLFFCFLLPTFVSAGEFQKSVPAPEFTQTDEDAWINSKPLKLADLEGKVVLIDVWTYGCINCTRSIPWLKHLEKRFKDQPFQIVGIHSPEFPWEKVRFAVKSKTKSLGLSHPVMMDNDFAYWKALGNQYWPAFYLVDQSSNMVAGAIGEIHIDQPQALAMEERIEQLLAKK